jgi:hypothetical protein
LSACPKKPFCPQSAQYLLDSSFNNSVSLDELESINYFQNLVNHGGRTKTNDKKVACALYYDKCRFSPGDTGPLTLLKSSHQRSVKKKFADDFMTLTEDELDEFFPKKARFSVSK